MTSEIDSGKQESYERLGLAMDKVYRSLTPGLSPLSEHALLDTAFDNIMRAALYVKLRRAALALKIKNMPVKGGTQNEAPVAPNPALGERHSVRLRKGSGAFLQRKPVDVLGDWTDTF